MSWPDIFKTLAAVLTAVGSAGVIILALSSWLGKVWAARILAQEKCQHAKQLEDHKAELEKMKKEHAVTFTRLHEKRAEVIETLYSHLVETDESFHSLIKSFQPAGEPELPEKFATFVGVYNAYYRFFQKKRIYFSQTTCETIDKLNRLLFESHIDLTTYPIDTSSPEYRFTPSLMTDRRKYWMEAWERYKTEMTDLKKELESSFRALLGVET
ncbi:hypothetical protein ACFLQR_01220 [Verrucomicrobiota bacterium]